MDIKLNFICKGDGFPLILLHGNGESCEYFSRQTEYFSKHYRVYATDTRGHGKSERGDGEFSLKSFANDLYEFMLEHGIKKAHIIGFSDGAGIVLYFALKHTEMVEKAVLCGGNISPDGVKRYFQIPVELGYKLAKLFAAKSRTAAAKAEILGLMVNGPHITPDELKAVTVPVLVIAGTHDVIKKSHTCLIAKSLPCSTLKFIRGRHSLPAQRAEEFNSAVENFLKTQNRL